MKTQWFSINWGKGTSAVLLVAALVLVLGLAFSVALWANPDGVAVDWGSSPMNACPPGALNCTPGKLAVDWGSLRAPCLPTDPKCGLGPLAVDWGSMLQPPKG